MFDLSTVYLVISTKLVFFNNLWKTQVLLSLLCKTWCFVVICALPGLAFPLLAASSPLTQGEDILQPCAITGTISSFVWGAYLGSKRKMDFPHLQYPKQC